MEKASTHTERSYYLASPNETDCLLLWVPREKYPELETQDWIPDGAANELAEEYPLGLVIEVSEEGFEEFDLDLKLRPEEIKQVYLDLRRKKQLPPGGAVLAADLERMIREAEEPAEGLGLGDRRRRALGRLGEELPSGKLRAPDLSDGEDALTFLSRLG
jgi:hypothetical protein